MVLSAAQITDLEQIIMTPIDMIGNTTSKRLLIDYLINSTDATLKKVLASPEAKQALENILEQKYLVADLWLKNKIFLAKGEEGQAKPTREEIANIMFQKLVKENNLNSYKKQQRDPHSEKRSFIYKALVGVETADLMI